MAVRATSASASVCLPIFALLDNYLCYICRPIVVLIVLVVASFFTF